MNRPPSHYPAWCDDPHEILALLRWMHADDELGPLDMDNVFEILEKPWHFDAEYQRMHNEQSDAERTRAR
jgi:hypothetical protein